MAMTNVSSATSKLNGAVSAHNAALARIKELEAQLAAAKQAKQNSIGLRVSEKGAVSIYGLGRFPVTLYAGQWERILAVADEVRAFIKANQAQLSRKE